MIHEKIEKSLNRQINREMYSAYLYLSMSAYATSQGLVGTANWFMVQTQEEMAHAMKIYDYVNQQGGRVVLEDIEAPQKNFKSILDAFEKTLEHEKLVTSLITTLVALAKELCDNATEIFLQWFVTEQIEEEANPTEIIQKLKLAGSEGGGLFLIDQELGARVFTPPQATQN